MWMCVCEMGMIGMMVGCVCVGKWPVQVPHKIRTPLIRTTVWEMACSGAAQNTHTCNKDTFATHTQHTANSSQQPHAHTHIFLYARREQKARREHKKNKHTHVHTHTLKKTPHIFYTTHTHITAKKTI
jgi:hypothetical protein